MNQDPYRPPGTRVDDVEPEAVSGEPLAVANAIRLLWIDVWLTVVYFGWSLSSVRADQVIATLISAAIGIGISVFLVFMVRQRRNWARYVTVVLVALSVLSGLSFPEETPAMEYVFFLAMLAIVLLFSKPSQRWFMPTRK